MDLLENPETGKDFYTLRKAKAPAADTGALKEVEKQRNYTSFSATKTLRPHQSEAVDAVFKALDKGITRQLIEAATGTGKTFTAVYIAGRIDGRVLFLVHRQELLHQTIRAFQDAGYSSDDIGVIWKNRCDDNRRFVIGMVQTVHARLASINPQQFECVIIDECHHATAKTWRQVAEYFTPRLRLGLSATPERADGAPLNDLFDEVTYSLGIRKAIEQELLVKPIAIQTRTELSLDKVRTQGGDFNEEELQAALDNDERNQLIVEKYQEHAADRKTLVFAAGIGHAKSLATAFQEKGIAAEYIYGNDPDRAGKLEAFSFGEIQVLTNAMLLTTGFDQPDVGAIVFARPTQSRPLYAQMLGRGLRLSPNKTDCTVLDFVDNTSRHSIVTAWNFFGHQKPSGDELRDCSQPIEIMPVEGKGEALKLKDVSVVDRWVDLLQPPPEVNPISIGAYAWHREPATEAQIAKLSRHGIDAKGWTKGQASSAIDNLPITRNQQAALLARGFDVITKSWTRGMVDQAFELADKRGVKPDWTLVRRAGL